MNKFEALIKYFEKKYPDTKFQIRSYATPTGILSVVDYPGSFLKEIESFFSAWDSAYTEGYADASKKASEEYAKNIQEIVTSVHLAGYNQGFGDGNDQGFDEGINQELECSLIPSDAFDVEIFAVKPSIEYPSGKQAFIGFKFLNNEGNEEFHYIQAQFAVPNLTIKSK